MDAPAGELSEEGSETVAQPAAFRDAAAGFEQISQAEKIDDWNDRQHSQTCQEACQAKQPFQHVTQAIPQL